MKKLFGKRGFTLIELVLVMVLLAALAAVVYPRYLDLRDDAHRAQDQAIIGALRSGIHIFYARYREFPDSVTELQGTLEEVPQGWTFTQNTTNGPITIQCDGLPSNNTNRAVWRYTPSDGRIELVTPHPNPN